MSHSGEFNRKGGESCQYLYTWHLSEGEVGEKWVGTFPELNYNLQWLVQVPEVLSRRTTGWTNEAVERVSSNKLLRNISPLTVTALHTKPLLPRKLKRMRASQNLITNVGTNGITSAGWTRTQYTRPPIRTEATSWMRGKTSLRNFFYMSICS